MLNFNDWVKENYNEDNFKENATKRAGTKSWAYPTGYIRSQYPSNYFPPYSATAAYNMKDKSQASVDSEIGKVSYKNFNSTEA